MPFAALTGFEELMAEKKRKPPNPTILPERRCLTRPRRAGASDRPRIAKVQHAPGTQESGIALGARGAGKSAPRAPAPRCNALGVGRTEWTRGQGAATTRHPRRAGALATPSRKAPRPPTAPGTGRTRSALRAPPPRPADRPRHQTYHPRARTTACYAFLQIGQLRGINPHQHQQEESYVPDFQFHRQR